MFCCRCDGEAKEENKLPPINRSAYEEETVTKAIPATIATPKEEPKAVPVAAPPPKAEVVQPEPEQAPPEAPPPPVSLTVSLDAGGSLDVNLIPAEIPELPAQARGCVVIKGAMYEADGANGPWGAQTGEGNPPPKMSKTSGGGPGVFPGDAILEVNGTRFARGTDAEAALKAAQQAGGSVRLGLQPRKSQFRACLVRKEGMAEKIGLSVLLDKQVPDRLTVRVVREKGMVAEWNAANRFVQLCPGDVVLGVNDISGRADEMLELLKHPELGAKLELQVQTAERKCAP